MERRWTPTDRGDARQAARILSLVMGESTSRYPRRIAGGHPDRNAFVIGAITLGHVDEHPFVRQGRRETRITLTNPEDAEKPSTLKWR